MTAEITRSQLVVVERITESILAAASSHELILLKPNIQELEKKGISTFEVETPRGDLLGFGAAEAATIILPAVLTFLGGIASGFASKFGEEVAKAVAGLSMTDGKPDKSSQEYLVRLLGIALRGECLRKGCGEDVSEAASQALIDILSTDQELLSELLPPGDS